MAVQAVSRVATRIEMVWRSMLISWLWISTLLNEANPRTGLNQHRSPVTPAMA
jgi:hypothetical protein